MTFYDHHLNYERLTHIDHREPNLDILPNRAGSRILSALKAMGHQLIAYLAAGDEPRVRHITDRTGLSYWIAYDPRSNTSARLMSEREVISWIENRY
jgi:hypothetical protein